MYLPRLEDLVPKSAFALAAEEDAEDREGGLPHKTLHIDFEPCNGEVCDMISLDSGYCSARPYKATNITRLTERTYSGEIEAAREYVILKFAYDEVERARLCTEAGFYQNQLRRVQRIIVPRYIGHFGTSDGEITCLVTRKVGEPIESFFMELPADERLWIFNAVETVHACGLQHNDLQLNSVRLDRVAKKAWVLDFEVATKHKCTHQPVILGGPDPHPLGFGCLELFNVAQGLMIWISPGNTYFCDKIIEISEITKWEDLLPFTYDRWSEEEKKQAAQVGFHHVRWIIGEKTHEYFEANDAWFP